MKDNDMIYAIVEDGIVTNIIWLYPGTEFENSVPCKDYPVQIGDTYENERFYRNGELVLSPMEDMINALALLGIYQ